MVYIITAIYAEAHAFITRFHLKKDISHTRFQVFRNDEAGLCLIISGTGSIPAAAAVSSICTNYRAGKGDFLINAGICAGIVKEKMSLADSACQIGKIFLCNKIREQATGKTFYPDILYRHGFAEAQIITGAAPYGKTAPLQTRETDFCLYDMEAASVYQAGSYFFGPHQMGFLKIVSDDGNTENVTPGQAEHLIAENMESIADYMIRMQDIIQKEQQRDPFQGEMPRKVTERLCLDMHCSKVMSESVRQHILYCTLSNIDYVSIIEKMYQEGKLPCKDKREGKQCFEELKARLL